MEIVFSNGARIVVEDKKPDEPVKGFDFSLLNWIYVDDLEDDLLSDEDSE